MAFIENFDSLKALPPHASHDEESESDGESGAEEASQGSTDVLVRPKPETRTPSFYKVLMLNDDYTPRDFVVHVLEKFFSKEEQEATTIMLRIHHQGVGVAGVYTYEVAETKAYQCNEYARQNKYPLKCTVEKA